MIVSLDEIKRVLGIPLESMTEDENLTRLIGVATEWVEGKTHRRFSAPILRTEFLQGTGRRRLYLSGHVDDSIAADNISEALDPTTSVVVSRRPLCEPTREWEALVEGEDWERREDMLLFLRMWNWWPMEDEFRVVYYDGYVNAPEDIKAVIIELAIAQYSADADMASGMTGITSEKLGDYSYSTTGSGTAGATGGGVISGIALSTINRYRRRFV